MDAAPSRRNVRNEDAQAHNGHLFICCLDCAGIHGQGGPWAAHGGAPITDGLARHLILLRCLFAYHPKQSLQIALVASQSPVLRNFETTHAPMDIAVLSLPVKVWEQCTGGNQNQLSAAALLAGTRSGLISQSTRFRIHSKCRSISTLFISTQFDDQIQ
eukprot:scaffold670982_cov47-Prasinocladus_malaysianus.AAC.1